MYAVCLGGRENKSFIRGLVNSVKWEAQGCLYICVFFMCWCGREELYWDTVFTFKCMFFFCVLVFTVYFVSLKNFTYVFKLLLIDDDVQTWCFHGEIMKNNHGSWMDRDFTSTLSTVGLQKKQELKQCLWKL